MSKPLSLTQQHIKRHPEKLNRFTKVRIRSGQWGSWWRANGSGYTTDISQAGVYTPEDAWLYVSHVGPEKRIVLFEAVEIETPETKLSEAEKSIATLEQQLRNMAALVEKKNEALIKACELIEKFSLQVHNGSDCLRIYNAVELQPSGVELVEVGKVNEVGGSLWASQYSPNNGVKVGDIVYTIKQKR